MMSIWYMGVMFISLKPNVSTHRTAYKTQEQFGVMRKPQSKAPSHLGNRGSCWSQLKALFCLATGDTQILMGALKCIMLQKFQDSSSAQWK